MSGEAVKEHTSTVAENYNAPAQCVQYHFVHAHVNAK